MVVFYLKYRQFSLHMIIWKKYINNCYFIILIPIPDSSIFTIMLGAKLGPILYGDVPMMRYRI